MAITLNGTTGITTPDLTSAAPMDVGGSAVLTAASSLAAANLTGALPAISGAALTDLSGTPTGALLYFAASTAPTGFIKANGASLDTTTYADLFAIVGYTYGGSGASFTLPDLRGEFMRGWDDARGVDGSRVFGSAQADEFKLHGHPSRRVTQGSISNDTDGGGMMIDSNGSQDNRSAYTGTPANVDGQHIGGEGGSETRPRNIALLACIKY